jgi:hypothetical protein
MGVGSVMACSLLQSAGISPMIHHHRPEAELSHRTSLLRFMSDDHHGGADTTQHSDGLGSIGSMPFDGFGVRLGSLRSRSAQ